jgi:hypothetical protein
MRLRALCLLMEVLILGSYVSSAKEPDFKSHAISYCDLVKSSQFFSGKRVRVRAIFRYGFEIQRLDPPDCCPELGDKIWVEIQPKLDGGSRKLYRKFPKGMGLVLVTLEGTFETEGPYGDGGYRSRLVVDRIERLEATAKASPHEPRWVPQQCQSSRSNADSGG